MRKPNVFISYCSKKVKKSELLTKNRKAFCLVKVHDRSPVCIVFFYRQNNQRFL